MSQILLDIEGMTCASCVSRVENKLNAVEGVEASVNLVTEKAAIRYDDERVSVEDLVQAVVSAGYHAAPPTEQARERNHGGVAARLLLAAVLTAPLAGIAMIGRLQFAGWEWVALALATPVVFWSGWSFHRAAAKSLIHRAATMDTLISLGTLTAWTWSVVALTAVTGTHTYFEVAAVITTLILLGRFFEDRARRRSGDALRALASLSVPDEEIAVGDLFVVRPGQRIAADGVVVEGESAIDRSLLTGEPVPVDVAPGNEVEGGTMNTFGRLVIRATKVGSETAVAQIARLVESAQTRVAPVQRLADRVSSVFVPVVLGISAATLVGWLAITGEGADAFAAAVAVLIIACPCALGLATPTALMVGTGRGAQLGILIRGPEILERTRQVTTVVLDKTGTVTEGRMRVVGNGLPPEVLRLAGAVEDRSEHPVARAVAEAARARFGDLPRVEGFRNIPGRGAVGVVEGRRVEIAGGEVFVDGESAGRLSFQDVVKPTSAQAVADLKALGLTPVLLTGDAEATARSVAAEVGIDRVLSEVLPGGKADEVRRLQASGEVVAMIGDGINDAPALAEADLGIAMGTGTDVAIEASDLTLVSGDLRAAADAIRLSRRVLATIRANLFWAFAYNVAAIPLAVAGLLNPMVAAAAMAGSSLFVVTNSLRLRRFTSPREVQ
jgi:Cu+-exporting ATPase